MVVCFGGSQLQYETTVSMDEPTNGHVFTIRSNSQRLEHELSPVGLGLHVSGEDEEEGEAVGEGGAV